MIKKYCNRNPFDILNEQMEITFIEETNGQNYKPERKIKSYKNNKIDKTLNDRKLKREIYKQERRIKNEISTVNQSE